jgi:hypothetical protein
MVGIQLKSFTETSCNPKQGPTSDSSMIQGIAKLLIVIELNRLPQTYHVLRVVKRHQQSPQVSCMSI